MLRNVSVSRIAFFSIFILFSTVVTYPVEGKAESTSTSTKTLRTHVWGPSRSLTKGYEWWAQEVTKKTGGSIKFEHFYNESLSSAKAQIDNLKTGLFDICLWEPAYAPGKTPLYTVGALPGLHEDCTILSKALNDISNYPELEEELKKWNAKYLFGVGVPTYVCVSKKPIVSFDSLKGLRLRTRGEHTKLAHQLGAVPVAMPSSEIYGALEKGSLDGILFPFYAFCSFSMYEIAKNVTFGMGWGSGVIPLIINTKTWNELSSSEKDAMRMLAKQVPEKYKEIYEVDVEACMQKAKENGVHFVTFTNAQREKLDQLKQPIWDGWATNLKEKGGPKVLEGFVKAIQANEK